MQEPIQHVIEGLIFALDRKLLTTEETKVILKDYLKRYGYIKEEGKEKKGKTK